MHIVRAFEEATKSRDTLVSKLTKLSMDAAAAGNMDHAEVRSWVEGRHHPIADARVHEHLRK